MKSIPVIQAAATPTSFVSENSTVETPPQPSMDVQKKTIAETTLAPKENSLTNTEKKLLTMQGYTLQMLGSRRTADLKIFITKHKLPVAHIMQFRTEYLGKPWYVLLYGNYDDVQGAKLALKQLSKTARGMHPWVRPMASVHQAIKQKM